MATLNAKVTLSSSDVASSSINIGVTKSITITAGGINTIKVTATAVGATASTVYTASDFSAPI